MLKTTLFFWGGAKTAKMLSFWLFYLRGFTLRGAYDRKLRSFIAWQKAHFYYKYALPLFIVQRFCGQDFS